MQTDELQRLSALEAKRAELAKALRTIEATLSQKRIYERGRELTAPEYHARRAVAMSRKTECLNALSDVNAQIKQLNRVVHGPPGLARELLAQAFTIIDEIEDLEPAEQALREKIRMFLNPSQGV